MPSDADSGIGILGELWTTHCHCAVAINYLISAKGSGRRQKMQENEIIFLEGLSLKRSEESATDCRLAELK